jgi:glycine/D-amino acid oxidase-like deaminating enzyme
VAAISAAPVLGKLLAGLIVDGQSPLAISSMHISRLGKQYEDAETLRQACEAVYVHSYAIEWGKI